MFPSLTERVDPFAAVSEVELADDLRLLMRGPGAQPGQAMTKVGPALRKLCGIASSDGATDAIGAVAAWLRSRISSLDSDAQRMCALVAFGLDETAQFPAARARLAAAAERLERSVDTARRCAMAAITAMARSSMPGQSVPLQLRRYAGGWVELGIASDDGHTVLTARCFLVAAARPIDQADKVYAIIHFGTHHSGTHRAAFAIPAVRVRHVQPTSYPGNDTLIPRDHER